MRLFTKWMTALAASFAILAALAGAASAQYRIDITEGAQAPTPVALVSFEGADPASRQLGRDIVSVIKSDLTSSGLFRLIDEAAFIERDVTVDVVPRHQDWRTIGADILLVGRVTLLAEDRARIDIRAWDALAGQQIFGTSSTTSPENWRRVGHRAADAIYTGLTGEAGYFDSRVVYIGESGPKTDRTKRLCIMDQDGFNPTCLTPPTYQVLTPRFSPTAQLITYMSFAGTVPQVYLFDIETGRQEVLGDFPGMTFAPRFTPDGSAVVMSLEQGGNSEIYHMDLRTRRTTRLTNHQDIDTSPSMSPDGQRITFTSDRGGSMQIYTMNANGSDVKRISFGSNSARYSTPVWSPRGDLIAFTKQEGGNFAIGVMRPDGSGERILSDVGYLLEGPTWSPNGRVILFTKETRPGADPELWSVDLTGRNLRRLETPSPASDPAWSPLLQ